MEKKIKTWWCVTIACKHRNGKVEEHEFLIDGELHDATRIIHTYRPKRGWVKFAFRIDQAFEG